MSYCPKCGNKVDETMTFCPRCGASLRTDSSWSTSPAPTTTSRPPVRNEKQEKNEKNEKQEKHEKGAGGSHMGWFIAGVVIVLIGVISYVNATWGIFNGAVSGAIILVIIGVLIVAAGVYFSSRARSRNPAPT